MIEERDDGKTANEHAAGLREAVRLAAVEAVEKYRKLAALVSEGATIPPAAVAELGAIVAQDVRAAWAEYHGALVGEMIGVEATRLAELYQAVRDAVTRLGEVFP